jgi:hypothetical protein
MQRVGLSLIGAITLWVGLSLAANADSELNCTFKTYNVGGTDVNVVKSYIPEFHRHLIRDNKTVLHLDFGLDGTVTKDNSKRIEFHYEFVNNNTPLKLKYTYFRTNKKVSASLFPSGDYYNIGPIWGLCEETTSSGNYVRYSDATDAQVCNEATLSFGGFVGNIQITNDDGTVKNQGWIDEAKRRWGENYVTHCSAASSASQGSQSSSSSSSSSSLSKLEKARATCSELGFTAGTEQHGNCVLKMIDY